MQMPQVQSSPVLSGGASENTDRLGEEAREFIGAIYQNPAAFTPRMNAINQEIESAGSYMHTAHELEIGAKLAWRNNARCIGRHLRLSISEACHLPMIFSTP